MKKLKIALISLVLLILPVSVFAAEIKSEASYTLASGDELNDDLFVSGQTIVIDGKVNGDVFAAGNNIKVTGEITGSLFAVASTVDVQGKIGNDLFAAAGSVFIDSEVEDNIFIAGGSAVTQSKFRGGRDLFIAAGISDISGYLARNLYAGSGSMNVNGRVDGDAYLQVGDEDSNVKYGNTDAQGGLTLKKGSAIGGNLEYQANQKAKIESGAKVTGKTTYKPYPTKTKVDDGKTLAEKEKAAGAQLFTFAAFRKSVGFVEFVILAILFLAIFKRQSQEIITAFRISYGKTFGVGVLVLFIIGFLFLALPLSILMVILGAQLPLILAAVVYLVLYMSKIITAYYLGELIMRKLFKEKTYSPYAQVAVGAIVVSALIVFPIFGILFKILIMAFGLGAAFIWCYQKMKRMPEAASKTVSRTRRKVATKISKSKKK